MHVYDANSGGAPVFHDSRGPESENSDRKYVHFMGGMNGNGEELPADSKGRVVRMRFGGFIRQRECGNASVLWPKARARGCTLAKFARIWSILRK